MSFVQKMKELIDSGAIGQVKTAWCRHFISYGGDAYFKDWHSEQQYVTGLLLQKATHDIDVLHWLCGGNTVRVNAMGGLTLYDQVTNRRLPSVPGDPTFRAGNWPPLTQEGFSPVIDVEDVSMMNMELDNGIFAAYQQCHFTPDAWRNYTVIGTLGRIENFGDDPPNCTIRLWNQRTGYSANGDLEYPIPLADGTHGGADPKIVMDFLNYVRYNTPTLTSPLAARNSVAAGYMATLSLRQGGVPFQIPPPRQELIDYFGCASSASTAYLL
jgi:predicted dehydrogenase